MPYREEPAIEKAAAELAEAAKDAHIVMSGCREINGRFLDYFEVKNRLGVALEVYAELREIQKGEGHW
jgi:succinate dehydrogenase/fumarate reductase flavoprotein subunit